MNFHELNMNFLKCIGTCYPFVFVPKMWNEARVMRNDFVLFLV